MLYTVKMKYFDGRGDCYADIDGKFPNFSLAWKMINLIKPEEDTATKFYKMDRSTFEPTNVAYTTCDGARRALNRAPKDDEGIRRLILNVSWDYPNSNDETSVLIIIRAEADKDF